MKFADRPTEAILNGVTIFDDVITNAKKLPDSLVKANAVRRGSSALDTLKTATPPIGFTGHVHPLTADAEAQTSAAIANDDETSHVTAADAHDNAAKKMAGFLKETGPKKHADYSFKTRGIVATHAHHVKCAAAHRDRAAFVAHEDEKNEADETKDRPKDKGDKVGKKKVVDGKDKKKDK